jgi:hypothetical protein
MYTYVTLIYILNLLYKYTSKFCNIISYKIRVFQKFQLAFSTKIIAMFLLTITIKDSTILHKVYIVQPTDKSEI